MTYRDASDGSGDSRVDPVAALVGACHHYATHLALLTDKLAAIELSDGDAEAVADAIQRVVNAAGMAAALTVGRQRHMPEAACPHYNVLTDAEWGPLSGKYVANERKLAYGCELQPGHAGPHMSEVQLVPADPDQFVWIRWTDRQRELIALAPCQAEYVSDRAEDPNGVHDEPCVLFEGHEGVHSFEF